MSFSPWIKGGREILEFLEEGGNRKFWEAWEDFCLGGGGSNLSGSGDDDRDDDSDAKIILKWYPFKSKVTNSFKYSTLFEALSKS